MKKKIIADHFNEMANKSEIKKTNQYGSENVTPLLRQPYIYIEDIIKYESTEKMICTDIIESFLLDNYPHIFNTVTRSEIKIWVDKYLESKK